MNLLHPNSKLTPTSRAAAVRDVLEHGWPVAEVAARRDVSPRTIYKWIARYREGGVPALQDRRSVPHRLWRRTPPGPVRRIVALRRRRWPAWRIARELGMPRSTVSAVLRREGLGRLGPVEPPPPVRRYERARAGELLHLDIKKLGRFRRAGHRRHGDRRRCTPGAGWEYVHVCVDDATRLAYVEVLESERTEHTLPFVERAVAWMRRQGIEVQRLMTDNGPAYVSKRFRALCDHLGVRHLRTRPYTPRTNGKAERFIQTLQREWAYAKTYRSSHLRRRALPPWLRYYNRHRPHRSLGDTPPLARLRALS